LILRVSFETSRDGKGTDEALAREEKGGTKGVWAKKEKKRILILEGRGILRGRGG